MKKQLLCIIILLVAMNIFAQTQKKNTKHPAKIRIEYPELCRKVPGLSIETIDSSSHVFVKKQGFTSFDSTLFSIDVKDVKSWTEYMETIRERVIPAKVFMRLNKLAKENPRQGLSIWITMEVERETGRIINYTLDLSRKILDKLTDDELQTIYHALGKESINTDLLEFRVLTAEQEQKINEVCYGSGSRAERLDPLDVIPMNERKLVDKGLLVVPLLQLNMRLFYTVKFPAPTNK